MDTAPYAHQRGKSSLSSSSSGGGRRYNISHPTDQPQTLVSPPFQAFRQAGHQNGTIGAGYPGYTNGQTSANHHQAYSSGSNGHSQSGTFSPGHRTGGSIANANGMASNGVHNNEPPSTRVRHKRPDTEEIKRVAHIHYEELFKFLKSHLAKGEF